MTSPDAFIVSMLQSSSLPQRSESRDCDSRASEELVRDVSQHPTEPSQVRQNSQSDLRPRRVQSPETTEISYVHLQHPFSCFLVRLESSKQPENYSTASQAKQDDLGSAHRYRQRHFSRFGTVSKGFSPCMTYTAL